MQVRGCGPTHAETGAEKVGTTIVLAMAVVVLLAFRARHKRRQRAALRTLQIDLREESAQVGDEREAAHVRIEMPTAASACVSEPARISEPAISSEDASGLEKRHRGG
jgi:hypothetical protein